MEVDIYRPINFIIRDHSFFHFYHFPTIGQSSPWNHSKLHDTLGFIVHISISAAEHILLYPLLPRPVQNKTKPKKHTLFCLNQPMCHKFFKSRQKCSIFNSCWKYLLLRAHFVTPCKSIISTFEYECPPPCQGYMLNYRQLQF